MNHYSSLLITINHYEPLLITINPTINGIVLPTKKIKKLGFVTNPSTGRRWDEPFLLMVELEKDTGYVIRPVTLYQL